MLQDLARRALRVRCKTRQVDTQSLLPRLVSLVLRRGAALPLPHAPPTGHQPPPTHGPAGSGLATMGQLGIHRLAVLSLLRSPSIPRRLLGAVHFHGSRLQRRQWRSLLGGLLHHHPRESPPSSSSRTPGGGRPSPKSPPIDMSYPFQKLCSSYSWSLQGIGSSRRGGIFRTWWPPILRRSQDFLSASQARRRMSISSE